MLFSTQRLAPLVLATGLALGSVFRAVPSHAENSPDRAAAEALFQLAQRLMKEGNYAEACPKLEASQKLDPGIGTLLFLGECEERTGRIASAWATFQEASALAKSRGENDRAEVAELRSAALRPRLTYMQFEVTAPARVPGLEIRRNGIVISPGSFGVSLPTDPGTYEIEATAPERAPWHTSVRVPPVLDAPLVVRVPVLGARAVASSGAVPSEKSPRPPAQDEPSAGSAQKTWALITLGAGALAGVAGGVLALLAKKENDDSKALCRETDPNVCKPEGVEKRKDAKKLAEFATVFAIGGGVLAGTGAVLYITAPSDPKGKTAGVGLRLSTRF